MDKQILDEKRESLTTSFEPIYKGLFMHPEEGEDFRINKAFQDIEKDMTNIDIHNKSLAIGAENLIKETTERLETAKYKIMAEKERLQDITMLCNKYTDFDNVVQLHGVDFIGADPTSSTLTAEVLGVAKTNLDIISVYGNGYEGNKYVFNNYEYTDKTMFTGNRKALTDGSVSTYYEYSRITASTEEEELITNFNYDSEEARCTITMVSADPINEIDIVSEWDGMQVVGIQSSKDGKTYEHIQIPKMSLNKKDDSYNNFGYIYGSGKIGFPSCKFCKLTLESTRTTNDTLAYEKSVSINGSPAVYVDTNIIKTAKRHLIKINDLNTYVKKYSGSSIYKSRDIIVENAYAIALFCNVYLPEGVSPTCVSFKMTVNGIDYNIEPINSDRNGIKVIRFSKGKFNPNYTKYISEQIKSAYLTVKIDSSKGLTPYINNVKILVGGAL